MKKLKPTLALLILASLFTVLSCSEGITPTAYESPTDPETTASSSVKTRKLTVMVHDRATIQPVEGVNVMGMPSRTTGITNKDGEYTFQLPVTDTYVIFNKKGYEEVYAPLGRRADRVGAIFDKK